MKRFAGFVAVIAVIALVAPQLQAGYGKKKDIVDTAVEAGNFKTLATALTEAGLVETLKGDGPFTVFAPTDEAFAKLPDGTVEALLKPENREKLVAILKYHVVSGRANAEAVLKKKSIETLSGLDVAISVKDGKAMANESVIVATDIAASNGVIHVIDSVLLPPEGSSSLSNTGDEAKLAANRAAKSCDNQVAHH